MVNFTITQDILNGTTILYITAVFPTVKKNNYQNSYLFNRKLLIYEKIINSYHFARSILSYNRECCNNILQLGQATVSPTVKETLDKN